MYFIGGGLGGRGTLPVDNTPAQRKTPLNPPPKTPPFLNLALGGGLSMMSDLRESPPPLDGEGEDPEHDLHIVGVMTYTLWGSGRAHLHHSRMISYRGVGSQ